MQIQNQKCWGCGAHIFFHDNQWLDLESCLPHNQNDCIVKNEPQTNTISNDNRNWFERKELFAIEKGLTENIVKNKELPQIDEAFCLGNESWVPDHLATPQDKERIKLRELELTIYDEDLKRGYKAIRNTVTRQEQDHKPIESFEIKAIHQTIRNEKKYINQNKLGIEYLYCLGCKEKTEHKLYNPKAPNVLKCLCCSKIQLRGAITN